MKTVQSQRQHRGTVARVLLSLYESGDLDNPELWTFERVAQLPAWCLLDAQARMQLQAVCGAIVLAPSMVRWVNGAAFRAVADVVGQSVLEALLEEAPAVTENESLLEPEPKVEQVAELIQATGAAVLHSSLDTWMPVERLTASIAPTDARFDRSLAVAILDKAELLLSNEVSH